MSDGTPVIGDILDEIAQVAKSDALAQRMAALISAVASAASELDGYDIATSTIAAVAIASRISRAVVLTTGHDASVIALASLLGAPTPTVHVRGDRMYLRSRCRIGAVFVTLRGPSKAVDAP